MRLEIRLPEDKLLVAGGHPIDADSVDNTGDTYFNYYDIDTKNIHHYYVVDEVSITGENDFNGEWFIPRESGIPLGEVKIKDLF